MGKVSIASSKFLPGKRNRANTHANATPMTKAKKVA